MLMFGRFHVCPQLDEVHEMWVAQFGVVLDSEQFGSGKVLLAVLLYPDNCALRFTVMSTLKACALAVMLYSGNRTSRLRRVLLCWTQEIVFSTSPREDAPGSRVRVVLM
jgi:hypothetical protein